MEIFISQMRGAGDRPFLLSAFYLFIARRHGQIDDAIRLSGRVSVSLGNVDAIVFRVIFNSADAADAKGISKDAAAIGVGITEMARAVTDAVRASEIG